MSEAEALLLNCKESEFDGKKLHDCKEEKNQNGFFNLYGWKTTIIIVLVLTSMMDCGHLSFSVDC